MIVELKVRVDIDWLEQNRPDDFYSQPGKHRDHLRLAALQVLNGVLRVSDAGQEEVRRYLGPWLGIEIRDIRLL